MFILQKWPKIEIRNTKVTKCHLFQEQSETFRTGSLCPAMTQETLSGDDDDCDEEDHDGDEGDAGDEKGGEEMMIIFVDDKIV